MELLLLGAGLGTAAGLSPGPLLTLVISSTLERGLAAGLRIAAAPLLSDGPVILISLLALGRLPQPFLQAVTMAGGVYVVYLGVKTLSTVKLPVPAAEIEPHGAATDYGRGILVNLLNPHPWIGWATVLGPLVVDSWRRGPWEAVGFLALFYVTLIGSKMIIAWLVARGRSRLEGRWYPTLLTLCGLLLVVLGLLLVRQGLTADPGTMAQNSVELRLPQRSA